MHKSLDPEAAARAASQVATIKRLMHGGRLTPEDIAQLRNCGMQLHRLLTGALRFSSRESDLRDVKVGWLGDPLPTGSLDGLSAFLVADGGSADVTTQAHAFMRALAVPDAPTRPLACTTLPLERMPPSLALVVDAVTLCAHGVRGRAHNTAAAGAPRGPLSPASSSGSRSPLATPSESPPASPAPGAPGGRSNSTRGGSSRGNEVTAGADAHDATTCGCPLIAHVTITASAGSASAPVADIEYGFYQWALDAGPAHLCRLAASAEAAGDDVCEDDAASSSSCALAAAGAVAADAGSGGASPPPSLGMAAPAGSSPPLCARKVGALRAALEATPLLLGGGSGGAETPDSAVTRSASLHGSCGRDLPDSASSSSRAALSAGGSADSAFTAVPGRHRVPGAVTVPRLNLEVAL